MSKVKQTNKVVRKGVGVVERQAFTYKAFKLGLSAERCNWFDEMAEKGFSMAGLIRDALDLVHPLGKKELWRLHAIESRPEDRADKDLVQVVEELGKKADGDCAKLEIVEVPDGTDWHIEEYDGNEHIAENHRTWR